MRLRHPARRPAISLMMWVLGLFLVASWLAGMPGSAALASNGAGWIRLAHFSPNTPAVDVYLYSFGAPDAKIVLKHVSYGTVSPYEEVRAGEYTVAMRAVGASPSSPPVLSLSVHVNSGGIYTVAGMGPRSGLRLDVFTDQMTVPSGKSLVRIIQASLREHRVTVVAGSQVLARDLPFADVTAYVAASPGRWKVGVTGVDERTSLRLNLVPATSQTLVVLDGASGLELADLEDAVGIAVKPHGGTATGEGGTAPVPGSSPLPWVGLIAAGALCAGAGACRLRRVTSGTRRTR